MTDFARAALIRAGHTVAQALLAAIGSATLITEVNWTEAFSAAALAGLLSLLKSVATGLPETPDTFRVPKS